MNRRPAPKRYHQRVRRPSILSLAVTILVVSACSKDPDPPSGSGTTQTISGRELMGWDQQADDSTQLALFRYVIYVDGARNELANVACSAGTEPQRFSCSGKGPDLATGPHTLELATFTADEESARSAPLSVMVDRTTSGTSPAEWPAQRTETTTDGTILRLDKVLDGLGDPVDAAFLPDGRLFIAERTGRVRVVDRGQLQVPDAFTTTPETDGAGDGLLSMAVDPDFERTHFIFMVHATRTGSGYVFRLARYRELRGTLAERAVLLEAEGPPIADAAAVLRVGTDAKLYLAVGAAGFPGTLLRLNLDGTMPRDQSGTAPALAQGLQSPRGLGADPRSGLVWIADEQDGQSHLSGVALEGRPLRAVVRARHALSGGSGSMAFYAGNVLAGFENTLLVASPSGRHIERIRFSDEQPDQIAATETLLQDAVGPIQVVAVGPDGAIYFCTGQTLGKLSAASQ